MPMNIIVGKAKERQDEQIHQVLTDWGESAIATLDAIQDVNKFWRENQWGPGAPKGGTPAMEVEARIPARLLHLYLASHPDLDIQDDRQWYKFLNEHPEIDTRRERR